MGGRSSAGVPFALFLTTSQFVSTFLMNLCGVSGEINLSHVRRICAGILSFSHPQASSFEVVATEARLVCLQRLRLENTRAFRATPGKERMFGMRAVVPRPDEGTSR